MPCLAKFQYHQLNLDTVAKTVNPRVFFIAMLDLRAAS